MREGEGILEIPKQGNVRGKLRLIEVKNIVKSLFFFSRLRHIIVHTNQVKIGCSPEVVESGTGLVEVEGEACSDIMTSNMSRSIKMSS